jgi:hypothetical protein
MIELIIKIILELLSVLALASKQIKWGRPGECTITFILFMTQCAIEKFAQELMGRKKMKTALQRLDRLTQDEAQIIGAMALGAVRGLGPTTINTLNDDVLLSIFGSYRLDDDKNWNLQLKWFKLIHVCRRWRHLIYGFPSHLDLQLLCTNGTPVADMLNHSPPLPLIINYQNTYATMTTEDEEGILLALRHHDRVRRIVLHAPHQDLHKFLTAMNENFPTLERLSIVSTSSDDAKLVIPRAFQAARLSHLTLGGVTLSGESRSLSPTVSLVSLTFTNLRASPYFPAEGLTAQLQLILLLGEMSIGFSVPIPRTTLPAEIRFIRRSVSVYLEDHLARISDSCLRKFDVTLLNQLIYVLPSISRCIDANAEFRFLVAKINFNQNSFSISLSDNREQEAQGDRSLNVRVSCKSFDWQVSSAAQICGNELSWMLHWVEELAIDFYNGMPPEWRNEVGSRTWCDLLKPFERVKKLRIGCALTLDLSRALQPAEEQPGTGGGTPVGPLPLPVLQELVLEEGCDENALKALIDARHRGRRDGKASADGIQLIFGRCLTRTGIAVLTWGHSSHISRCGKRSEQDETFVVIPTSRYRDQHYLVGNQLQMDVQHWLSPPDPSENHEFVWKAHHTGNSAWFFESKVFAEWKASGSFLWIHGKRRFSLLLTCACINGFFVVQPGQGKVHFCMYRPNSIIQIAHITY